MPSSMNNNDYPFILIYGIPDCPFTQRAANLCIEYKFPHRLMYLTPAQRNECQAKYGYYRMPICIECYPNQETFIGGSDNLQEYFEDDVY